MYLDFYKMNASIYKVGESSIEKKNPTILLIKLNYRTRSFIFIFRFQTKTRRDFYFFYQKPSIGIYSTSEAYTIV